MEHKPTKDDCGHSQRIHDEPTRQQETINTSSDVNVDDQNKENENIAMYDANNNLTPETNAVTVESVADLDCGEVPLQGDKDSNKQGIYQHSISDISVNTPIPKCCRNLFGPDELSDIDSEGNEIPYQVRDRHLTTLLQCGFLSSELERCEDDNPERISANPLICLPQASVGWLYGNNTSNTVHDDEVLSTNDNYIVDESSDEDFNSSDEDDVNVITNTEQQIIVPITANSGTKDHLLITGFDALISHLATVAISDISNLTDTEQEDSEAEYDQPRLVPGTCAAPRRPRRQPFCRNERNELLPVRRRLMFNDNDDENNNQEEMPTPKRLIAVSTNRAQVLCPSLKGQPNRCHARRRLFDDFNLLDNRGADMYHGQSSQVEHEDVNFMSKFNENFILCLFDDENIPSRSNINENVTPRSSQNSNVTPRSSQNSNVTPRSSRNSNVTPRSNRNAHVTPRSRRNSNIIRRRARSENVISHLNNNNANNSRISCSNCENSTAFSNLHIQRATSSQPNCWGISSSQSLQSDYSRHRSPTFSRNHPNHNSFLSYLNNDVSSSETSSDCLLISLRNNVSSTQPSNDVSSTQPSNADSSNQPSNADSSSQPSNADSSSQPSNADSSSQPRNDVSSSQPRNDVSSNQLSHVDSSSELNHAISSTQSRYTVSSIQSCHVDSSSQSRHVVSSSQSRYVVSSSQSRHVVSSSQSCNIVSSSQPNNVNDSLNPPNHNVSSSQFS